MSAKPNETESLASQTDIAHCYCGTLDPTVPEGSFQCSKCKRRFHLDCLKNPVVSPLQADTFYNFTCADCAEDGNEDYCRAKISWLDVVMLCLYNLQLGGGGKQGYFRWRDHICQYIDKNWTCLFGSHRKKTTTWQGTVAGTISAGCPRHFVSGTPVLGEPGWWKLTTMKPPVFSVEQPPKNAGRKKRPNPREVVADSAELESMGDAKRLRRSKPFSLTAATELKAKRSAFTVNRRRARFVETFNTDLSESGSSSSSAPTAMSPSDAVAEDDSETVSNIKIEIETDSSEYAPAFSCQLLTPADNDSDDLDLDPIAISPTALEKNLELCRSPDMVDLVMNMPVTDTAEKGMDNPADGLSQSVAPSSLSSSVTQNIESAVGSEASSEEELEEESEEEEEGEEDANKNGTEAFAAMAQREREKKEEQIQQEDEEMSRYVRLMTPYDEDVMLKRLNAIMHAVPVLEGSQEPPPWERQHLCQQRNLLRRKLLVRKLKRDNGLPLFDINAAMESLAEKYGGIKPSGEMGRAAGRVPDRPTHTYSKRTFDRFMKQGDGIRGTVQHESFHTRLVGFEDHQLQPITSPYTLRVLKPFIWRDTETLPLKVKLMQEIIAYPHRNDPEWEAPSPASLSYCYVRPQHIPSVNALCHIFFWPGIDMSECLQYPDFSCVVMYRKLVVGFAFMVPDAKHNEAYISIIFTHPEWRRAGIATFMLYHLCQTCMGRDITLHVSATNPAMLLYQRFGFKAEELCLDFYDKYLPVDSKECRHAFFMRLR